MKFVILNIALLCIAVSVMGGEGTVFPAVGDIAFTHTYVGDTAVIEIQNYSSFPITDFVISDFSKDPVIFIDCEIDGQIINSIPVEYAYSDIYPVRVSSRWMIDYAMTSIKIRYYTQTGVPYYFNWHGKRSGPIFGIIETCCRERGDVDHSGGSNPVDVSDLSRLVEYMFVHSFIPPCIEEVNIDNFSSDINLPVNIIDLTYLIDYLFKDGDSPVLCR